MFQIYLAILTLFAFSLLKINFTQNKLKNIGIKSIYNMIYFYSACQIKCTQAYNYLLPYFKSDEIINQIKIEQFNTDTNKLTIILEDDLKTAGNNNVFVASASGINSNSALTNKLIIDKNIEDLIFDISNITFIALYLNYNDMRYNINLKTDEFNYYLVGNVIDKHFVQYYINTILNLKFSYFEPEILTYQLELMDHEVKMISLDDKQSIIIEKDGYRIVNNVTDDDDDDDDVVENLDLINESVKIIEDKSE